MAKKNLSLCVLCLFALFASHFWAKYRKPKSLKKVVFWISCISQRYVAVKKRAKAPVLKLTTWKREQHYRRGHRDTEKTPKIPFPCLRVSVVVFCQNLIEEIWENYLNCNMLFPNTIFYCNMFLPNTVIKQKAEILVDLK